MSKRKHAWKWNQRFDRAIKHKNYKNSMFYKPPTKALKKHYVYKICACNYVSAMFRIAKWCDLTLESLGRLFLFCRECALSSCGFWSIAQYEP